MPQRTPSWYAIRRGKFTASEFGMWVANPDKDATSRKAFQNAIDAKLGDEADGDDTDLGFENYWMKRGTRLEMDALAAYESRTNYHVDQFGFVEHESGCFGCSPDGLIFDRSHADSYEIDPATGKEWYLSRLMHGLEMKCPKGSTQVKYLREGVLPAEYVCQVHGSMAITGAAYWDFWSWHPNLPSFCIRTHRDEFTERMFAGLLRLASDYEDARRKLANMWDDFHREGAAA